MQENKPPKRTKGATARIPVTNETFRLVRGFKFGAETSYDAVIRSAMAFLIREGENPVQAGERELDEWRRKTEVEEQMKAAGIEDA